MDSFDFMVASGLLFAVAIRWAVECVLFAHEKRWVMLAVTALAAFGTAHLAWRLWGLS